MQVLKGIVPEPTQPGAPAEGTPLDHQQLLFCERFLELAVDLLSQLPTRRFVRTLLDDRALLVKCRLAGLFGHQQGARLEASRELASCRVLCVTTLNYLWSPSMRGYRSQCCFEPHRRAEHVAPAQAACSASSWTCCTSTWHSP